MHSDSPILPEVRELYNQLAVHLTEAIGEPVQVIEKSYPKMKLDDDEPDGTQRYSMELHCGGIDLSHACSVYRYNARDRSRSVWRRGPEPAPDWKLKVVTYSRDHGRRSFPELKAGGYNWASIGERVASQYRHACWMRERAKCQMEANAILKRAAMGKWRPIKELNGSVSIESTADPANPVRLKAEFRLTGKVEQVSAIINKLIDAELIELDEKQ